VLRISLVTPSFNQAGFLPKTLSSVHGQGYPDLEHIVFDGGSTDGSVRVIEQHAERLAYWISEPDGGQADALNKGFARATGEVFGWLNSDDILWPGALSAVAEAFETDPGADVVMGWSLFFRRDRVVYLHDPLPLSPGRLLYTGYDPPQDSIFWRRRVHERLGLLDTSLNYPDRDWFIRMSLLGVRSRRIRRPIGGFRLHDAQKTADTKLADERKYAVNAAHVQRLGVSRPRRRLLERSWGGRVRAERGVLKLRRLSVERHRVAAVRREAEIFLRGL
jgi:glycosyltransferase involved in cell wall biosynthesis